MADFVNKTHYYSTEQEATGYLVRVGDDNMTVTVKYFDFPGFGNTHFDGVEIFDTTFSTDVGLTKNLVGNETIYSYNISREFEALNLSQPIKRMLSTTLQFTLHSVRTHVKSRLATCLQVKGEVIYTDIDKNGQVDVDLETTTTRIKCKDMNLTIKDWQLEDISVVGPAVIALCAVSAVVTMLCIAFAGYVFWETRQFIKDYPEEINLSFAEYFRFLKFWDIAVLLSDSTTIYGTGFAAFQTNDTDWVLETIDSYTVWLGIGCIFAWFSLLRHFKFNRKFHLLFTTLYRAFFDVMAYLFCVTVLFLGFWLCGYVVLGPYHVKFRTPDAAAETLFGIVNGDEIYTTLAILDISKSGGTWVFWFSRFYIVLYVAVFAIVAINLLIALFLNAYESTKVGLHKEKAAEISPMETALQRYLIKKTDTKLSEGLNTFLIHELENSVEVKALKNEMLKFMNIGAQYVVTKHKTEKAAGIGPMENALQLYLNKTADTQLSKDLYNFLSLNAESTEAEALKNEMSKLVKKENQYVVTNHRTEMAAEIWPIEQALKQYLSMNGNSQLGESLKKFLKDKKEKTSEAKALKRELLKIVALSKEGVVIVKHKTLKGFMEVDSEDEIEIDCCDFFKVSLFVPAPLKRILGMSCLPTWNGDPIVDRNEEPASGGADNEGQHL